MFSNKTLPADSGSEWMEAEYALIKNNTVMMDSYSYLEDDNLDGEKEIRWINNEYRVPLMTGDVVLVVSVVGDKCEVYYPWSDIPGPYGWISTGDVDLDTMGNIDMLWAKQAKIRDGITATLYSEPDYTSKIIGDITGPVRLEAMGEGWFFAKEMVGGADLSGYIRQEDLIELTEQKILVSTERKKHPGIRFGDPSEPVTTVKISNSSTFSEEEIYDAVDTVEEFFNTEPSHSGCTLISLTYDDKWSQARSKEWKKTYGKKDMIGIKACFDTDETVVNTSGFAPNYRYEDYIFVVGRDDNSPWEIVTMIW